MSYSHKSPTAPKFLVSDFSAKSEVMLEDGGLAIRPEPQSGESPDWRGAFDEFLNLGNATDEAVAEYARGYGPLTLDNRRLATGVRWKQLQSDVFDLAVYDHQSPKDPYFEPVAGWRELAIEFAFLASKAGMLRRRLPASDDAGLVQYIAKAQPEWDESRERLILTEVPEGLNKRFGPARLPLPVPVDLGEPYDMYEARWNADGTNVTNRGDGIRPKPEIDHVDLVRRERELLIDHLGQLFRISGLGPILDFGIEHKLAKPTWVLATHGYGLFAGLTAQLAMVIASGDDYFECRACRRVFLFQPIEAEGKKHRRPRGGGDANCNDCKANGNSKLTNQRAWRQRSTHG